MTAFVTAVGLGYVVVALLPGGLVHLLRPAAFAGLVRAHGIVAPRWAGPVALAVAAVEVTTGGVAAVVAVGGGPAWPVLAVAVVLGPLFVAYLTRLLARGESGLGCGCTPLSGPLTSASLLPAAALTVVAATALVAGGPSPGPLLGAAWGAALAAVVILVPATVPAPEPESAPRARVAVGAA